MHIDSASLLQAFNANFAADRDLGAAVSIWQHGKEVTSLHGGFTNHQQDASWAADTLVPIFSATKGMAATTLLLALHRAGLSPNIQIGELWHTFPLPYASIAQVLSHQSGLASLAQPASIFDHYSCVRVLEQTQPAWQPPHHGYHPHTFGTIVQELMLRLTHSTTADYFDLHIRKPMDLDCYLLLPESQFHRVARLYPGKADDANFSTPFYQQYLQSGTPIYRAFHSLMGLESIHQMNSPQAWTLGQPALCGVASATGLAKFYQVCLGLGSIIPAAVTQWLSTRQTLPANNDDLTLLTPTAFSCGMMLDPLCPISHTPIRHLFCSTADDSSSFGHSGAGGSHAFALPNHGISFAYIMNKMELSILPTSRTRKLLSALLHNTSSN